VNGDATLTFGRGEQQGLLAEHEDRRLPEKMHANDCGVRLNEAGAIGKGWEWSGGVGHFSSVIPGRTAGTNPESIFTKRGYGFRVRGLMAAPRNDHHAMQLSKPLRILSSGKWRPMKTMRLVRSSPSFHFR
jgi:hypothetical protein